MIRFLLVLFLLSGLLLGLTNLAISWQVVERPSFLYETVILLVVTTGGIYFLLNKRLRHFLLLYLLTTVIKILAFGVYTLIVVLEDKKGANVNVIFFMICYFLFTAVEVIFLHRRVTGKNQS
ncbi:hypothetical protein [Chryseosolibacter indicus]|uniref:DUF4293 family protein n=1 Tax=Chryseosolibacter indicus TaxID=2782351 RepID=A0ABS5VNS4_9BACT|nr:hypothetical protein [Chryseosolibacter indicus]MBT1702668.1 hypothetical protein [Chryseosolibacter indicus]